MKRLLVIGVFLASVLSVSPRLAAQGITEQKGAGPPCHPNSGGWPVQASLGRGLWPLFITIVRAIHHRHPPRRARQ